MKKLNYNNNEWNHIGYFGMMEIYQNLNEGKRLLATNGKVYFTYQTQSQVDDIISKRMTEMPVRDIK